MKVNSNHILNWFLMFLLLLISAKTSFLISSDALLIISFVFLISLFVFKGKKIDRAIVVFTGLYIALTLFYLNDFGWINFTATVRIYIKIMYGYFTIKLIGNEFFQYFEDVVYKLALISLPLFLCQLMVPIEFESVIKHFSFLTPSYAKAGEYFHYYNFFIFTVNPYAMLRNSGFMWEPGAYAAVLALALPLNLLLNDFSILNRRFWILLLALCTTFSTTGFINILLIVIFFLLNTRRKYWIVFFPLFFSCAALIYNLDFVEKKIANQFSLRDKSIDIAFDENISQLDRISVGRFGSVIIDVGDALKRPFFGYGAQFTERTQSPFVDIQRPNGLSDYLAVFGFVGIILLVINLYRTFNALKRDIYFKGMWVLVVIVLCFFFSNPMVLLPFSLALQTYYIGVRNNSIMEQEELVEPETDILPE